jgi:hypothetical protein
MHTFIVQFSEAGKVWSNETFEHMDYSSARQSAIDAIKEASEGWTVHRVLYITVGRFPRQWVCIEATDAMAEHFMLDAEGWGEPVTLIVEGLIQRFYPSWENPDPDAPRSTRNEHSTLNRGQQL